ENLDKTLERVIEKKTDFDLCFAFMHNDAGMTYAATMSAISRAKMYSVIFGRNADTLAETIEFDCEKLVSKVVHNPSQLKNMLDKLVKERST
ncbi:MAG: DUF1890 family protein, partial [Methanosarcinaceae archaeon]|nr:DUF1890 family protein [Methanosarcinaceae archaeon]